MSRTTKILLTLSATGLIAGLLFVTDVIKVQERSWLYVALPAGAIFFGLFLISKLLEKETAIFDQEHHAQVCAAERLVAIDSPARKSVNASRPTLKEKPALAGHAG